VRQRFHSLPSLYCRVFTGKARFEAACGRLVPTADRRSATRVRFVLSAIMFSEARKLFGAGRGYHTICSKSYAGFINMGVIAAGSRCGRFGSTALSGNEFSGWPLSGGSKAW